MSDRPHNPGTHVPTTIILILDKYELAGCVSDLSVFVSNFARIVDRAQKQPQPESRQDEVRVAAAAAVAPRTVQPSIPSKTSVATQATVKNALNLRDLNLIGVYGKPSDRRALVRLGNGRYQKVVVGDRIDGGRVSAIGDNELRYTKRGRDLVLKMPR